MKLAEALKLAQQAPRSGAERVRVFLACGFQPLHLETFLHAHLRALLPDRHVELATGVYGDLAGNLDRMRDSGAGFAVVVIEWSDLDPRLGLRSLADGSSDVVPDILETVRSRCLDLAGRLEAASSAASLVISLPTLPLPPVATSPRELAGAL
jgi:hypothetical protein